MEIRRLVSERLDDFLAFFDRDAFADNPDWSSCYCMAMEFGGTEAEWDSATAEQNRAEKSARIRAKTTDGAIAYQDGRPIGWVRFGPMARYPAWKRARAAEGWADLDATGCITCFVVAKPHRRKGVSAALLQAALGFLREDGFRLVAALAPRSPADDGHAFLGPLPLYLAAGFEVTREGPERCVVRLALAPRA